MYAPVHIVEEVCIFTVQAEMCTWLPDVERGVGMEDTAVD